MDELRVGIDVIPSGMRYLHLVVVDVGSQLSNIADCVGMATRIDDCQRGFALLTESWMRLDLVVFQILYQQPCL